MALIVQKYGGTSVGDPERLRRCAARSVQTQRDGHQVVVVVSAMGHATDHLIDLAGQVAARPSPRELDMLMATGEQVSIALMAMAIQSQGGQAVSMTGGQLGIRTDAGHTRARIRQIDASRIRAELDRGRIVVAAGFQGITEDGEITTLGRGGSDTTAVALAAALAASPPATPATPATRTVCDIFTDVDGVYTADPRLVPTARKLERISYEEMLELASLGAGVMQSRAVLFGQKYSVPIHVRHSAKPDAGTLITTETPAMEDIAVVGCALKRDLGRISLRRVPNNPGVQGMVFRHIADRNIVVDDIMQTDHGDRANLSFTVEHGDLADVKLAAAQALEELGTGELAVEIGLAKVSAVGVGMRTHSGVAARMFAALGDADIPIANITTSEIKISCIVPQEHAETALQVVHDAFELSDPPSLSVAEPSVRETPAADIRTMRDQPVRTGL
jgi:aspartate kinase